MSNTDRDDKNPPTASDKPPKDPLSAYGGVTDDELEDLFLDFGNDGREAAGGAAAQSAGRPRTRRVEDDGPPAPAEVHLEADDDEPVLEVDVVVPGAIISEQTLPTVTQPAVVPPSPPPPRMTPMPFAAVTEPPGPGGPKTPLTDHATFRAEAQRLARAREWQKLAAVTSAAVDYAAWASLPGARAALLLDLARIHRDRLADPAGAEQAFKRLAQVDPSNDDALAYLADTFRARGEWRAIYDLYSAAIEPTWDPQKRLELTRETASIASDRLRAADLAIEAWERLERLGDAAEETYTALSEMYRRAGRWDRLAQFLAKRAAKLQGAERVVALREVAEAYLSGLRDHEQAGAVLEDILAARPDDVVALLAYARVLAKKGDWESLATFGSRALEGVPRKAVLDFRRVVAAALWAAGEHARAFGAYDRVLELEPDDAEALRCREEHLAQADLGDELLAFLIERADRAKTDDARAGFLARAATLAEGKLDDPRAAVVLWEKRAALPVSQLESLQALERLHERLGDLAGVARALEAQLALVKKPEERVPLLRRLGEHSAHRMADDVRAEACWKEILAIEPADRATHEELMALHRRRGDFESLDRALAVRARMSAAIPVEEVLGFWHTAAKNVDENIGDPRRAIAAFQRVLDLAPSDPAALAAIVKHRRALGRRRDLIAALEAELRVIPAADREGRTARALEIARLWEEEKQRVAALAAYERVLRWDPTDATALTGIALLRLGAEVGAAVGAFEVAAAAREDAAARIALLREALALTDPADKLGRFHTLRRILWLSGSAPAVLDEVEHAASEAGAWAELCAVYLRLAADTTSPEARASHHRALAKIYEERLADPVRAFLVLQASDRRPVESDEALAALGRLADATGRHEDLLAILDASAGAEVALGRRQKVLRARAEVLAHKVKDEARAFAECARLLALDPADAAALAEVRRLAEAKGLWRALDALYAELSDRAETDAARIELARLRHALRKDKLGDAIGALDQLLVAYRLDPAQPGLTEELLAAADAADAWDRVLPVVEAKVRAAGEAASPDELNRLAGQHEHQREDLGRAFELYGEAFVLRPGWKELEEDLSRVADKTGWHEELAGLFRAAAAHAQDPSRKLELLARVTRLHTDTRKDPESALDAHHRTLQLDPGALASLEVVIERHRAAGQWRELRDRLQQWSDLVPAAERAARVSRLLDIANISRDKLGDDDAALDAFARVLATEGAGEAATAEAIEGVRSLHARADHPRFELKRLRIELDHAGRDRRVELLLAAARLERTALGDDAAARRTLEALVAETGADGPGYEPLAALLRATGDHAALAALIEARAKRLSDKAARLAALAEAVEVTEHKVDGAPIDHRESLYRQLLDERPDDLQTRRRLLALYREAGRAEPLAALLADSITALAHHGDVDDADEVRQYQEERIRLLAGPLGRLADAEHALNAHDPGHGHARAAKPDAEGLLARASLALRRGEFATYLDLRQQHAKLLPAPVAALVLCHLAEACDEAPGQQLRVAGLYREARTLDPQNTYAMQALKAIGRRAKNWREYASLLRDPDEASLSFAARARRLVEHGDAAAQKDAALATDLYQRAVAIDPDCHAAWDGLTRLRAAAGDLGGALEAQRAALAAWERATAPSPDNDAAHAARLFALAEASRAAGDPAEAARLALRAHRIAPLFAPAAIAVADQQLLAGQVADAFAIYDRVLRDRSGALAAAHRLHATYRRGALAWRLGKKDEAAADLRAALALDPLHAGALQSLAEADADSGRIASAAQGYVQALLVEHDAHGRTTLYARLGRLWEDQLKNADEAGVCYDHAIHLGGGVGGPEAADLMARALQHYRRQGRPERALAVIERLLPSTQDPHELAALWTERASIHGSAGDEDRAVEAYDMALSYDPGNRGAITGLSQILERRGDWEQLAQIFEARTEAGTPDERAEALRALARMASAHLHDAERTARYLKSVIELAPTREDYEQLLALYGDDPARFEEKLDVLSGLLAQGGPYMPRLIEFGRGLVGKGDRRWAWCVLSPLMNSTLSDPQLKALVLELRKEFEKSDNVSALTANAHALARVPGADGPLAEILAELDEIAVIGRASFEEVGAGGTGRLDERTAVGKTFAAIAQRLGLEGTILSRAQEMPEPCVVLDGPSDQRHVIVRADLLQLLSIAETCFLFATLLEQSRPGLRLLSSLAPAERSLLVPALYAACGAADRVPGTAPLVDKLRAHVPAEKLAAWGERLRAAGGDPTAAGEALFEAQLETARRVGLVAAADLRFAARVLTRLDESLPKMQTVGRIDDLDEFIAHVPAVRALLVFSVTALFGKLLRGNAAAAA